MGVSTKYGDRAKVIASIAAGMRDAEKLGTYLELGVRRGKVFNVVAPLVGKRAYAVDTEKDTYNWIKKNKNLYWNNCTTDEFFANHDKKIKFDMIFIDADHSHEASLKDFENSIEVLNDNGLVLLHDTYPFGEKYFSPNKCHDTYKTAEVIRDKYRDEYEIVTLPIYLGISIVRKANKQLMWK